MITVKNAESYLKNKIGEDTSDIKKVWEIFKDFCKEPVEGEENKEIKKSYFNVVYMILLAKNYFTLILYASLLFMMRMSILV
jgi:hypothetical protein